MVCVIRMQAGYYRWYYAQIGYGANKYVPGTTCGDRRPPPFWMVLNMQHGLCWCGKPREEFEPRYRKYCCGKHAYMYDCISPYWSWYRSDLTHNASCVICGAKEYLEVDHIEALKLGGSMWDADNHRVLCKDCHIVKTRCDMRKIAQQKRDAGLRAIYTKTLLDYV
ncbi:MAG: HNH endonuclease [Cenarchaeum sp. SB0677_bin_16]|nr:HNH endonuclease [Cenarchaeum sp. SB0677_bin_16]